MNENLIQRVGFLGLMGALALVVAFALGVALNAALGPAFGGLLNAIATAFVVGLAIATVKSWYSPIVVWGVFSALAIPLTTMGPPGIHKLAIGLLTGIVVAVVLINAGGKVWRYAVAGAVMSALMTVLILYAMLELNLSPESAARLQSAIAYLVPVYMVFGAIGMGAASWAYNSTLSERPFFKNI